MTDDRCAPNGRYCASCNGTHHPRDGVTFTTGRNWWDTDDVDHDEDG